MRYPLLRLAHLFMLNATPWEAQLCHRKYRNPFFSPFALSHRLQQLFFSPSRPWDTHITSSQHVIGFSFHLPQEIWLPNNLAFSGMFFLLPPTPHSITRRTIVYFLKFGLQNTVWRSDFLTTLGPWILKWVGFQLKACFGPYTYMKS